MKNIFFTNSIIVFFLMLHAALLPAQQAKNPIIFADVPDMFIIRVDKNLTAIGTALKMSYTLPRFMGYCFVLFNYTTKEIGGYADFDYFRISDNKSK